MPLLAVYCFFVYAQCSVLVDLPMLLCRGVRSDTGFQEGHWQGLQEDPQDFGDQCGVRVGGRFYDAFLRQP